MPRDILNVWRPLTRLQSTSFFSPQLHEKLVLLSILMTTFLQIFRTKSLSDRAYWLNKVRSVISSIERSIDGSILTRKRNSRCLKNMTNPLRRWKLEGKFQCGQELIWTDFDRMLHISGDPAGCDDHSSSMTIAVTIEEEKTLLFHRCVGALPVFPFAATKQQPVTDRSQLCSSSSFSCYLDHPAIQEYGNKGHLEASFGFIVIIALLQSVCSTVMQLQFIFFFFLNSGFYLCQKMFLLLLALQTNESFPLYSPEHQ